MLEDEIAGLAGWLRRITVDVRSGAGSHGAGVVWRRDGLVVTNAHVATQTPLEVRLGDGRALAARVLRRDPARDLAALELDGGPLAAAEPGLEVRPGQLVLAAGHPLGLAGAIALGVVHSTPWEGPHPLHHLLKLDLRLAPGNSGGPVADACGRVVGVSTLIVNGLAHAIPSAAIVRFLREGRTHKAA
jgi:serine protease Do